MNKIINSVLMSVIIMSAIAGTASADYYTQTLNMGGDTIQPTQTIVTPTYQTYSTSPTERKTYTGSIIQTSNPEPTTVYVPVYQPYYNNYITTYSVVPYYRRPYYNSGGIMPYYTPQRPYGYSGISAGYNYNTGINTGSFAYNYQGHGFDYGFSSGRPLYVNRPGMQSPPPPSGGMKPPPNHKHDRNGAVKEVAKKK